MKKLILIKKNTILAVFLIGAVIFAVFSISNTKETYAGQNEYKVHFEPARPAVGSLEELYEDALFTMLLPYVQKAVTEYYKENTGYNPVVDPWQLDILSIERPNGYRTFLFIIKFEVAPYLGAHNSIGVDRITLKVSYKNVDLEKYEHIKSCPIPPWLKKQEE